MHEFQKVHAPEELFKDSSKIVQYNAVWYNVIDHLFFYNWNTPLHEQHTPGWGQEPGDIGPFFRWWPLAHYCKLFPHDHVKHLSYEWKQLDP